MCPMIKMPQLKIGDSCILLAPARKVNPEEMQFFIAYMRSAGYKILLSPNLYHNFNQFSGTDTERIADLQWALNHPTAKVIICARGGYGTVQIIDQLDFSTFVEKPKWIVGYSDITVLHNHLHQVYNIPSIHATMPINFPNNTAGAIHSLFELLKTNTYQISFPNNYNQITQTIKAPIVGGNLSIIYSLLGSISSLDTAGKILFIEDLDEYLYHLDRMMHALKRAGLLQNLKALLVGGMTDMHDHEIPFGKTAVEIIQACCATYTYPVLFDVPAGHINDNQAILMNVPSTISITATEVKIIFD